ncbi:tetraacyldisaccharide 4'-kinase [Aliarcobacter vitoriensis]|uniref:Tetraacyldisaccharide 4'-kinase n=1 Tax=Aliarcobacter vitoriensis TaxID=2011099 RepID=A0A366MUN0_9BACT|nr:tetraacyldisaccharide 4'-kinase [Aliarcobacter vitoriensis]RBQ29978.1 tetraacyldisaccharide 4'-kinase [Aliarcobacter vitoriensis]
MKRKINLWIEDYLFFPNNIQKVISFLLLPFSIIYLFIIFTKRLLAKKTDFNIPIISIGNLIIGGSGKTPITIKLASNYEKAFVILRGYGRESKGLQIVSLNGKILTDVKISGDEAMLLSQSLKNASVIVSEDRIKAILTAKELGAKIIFLDDGFSKYNISKFDILLKPKIEPTNSFCIPSGGYREPKSFYKYSNIVLQEEKDFKRVVVIKKDDNIVELPKKTILISAISKPKRLLEFLPNGLQMLAYPDHYIFTKNDIDKILEQYKGFSIVTTKKDFVKLKEFNLENIYLMDLSIEFDNKIDFSKLNSYIKKYN